MRSATALALLLGLTALVGDAGAQPRPTSASGPFAAVDLSGSPLVAGIRREAFQDESLGGTAGYRLNRRVDVALRIERVQRPGDPTLGGIPNRTLVGAGAALRYGTDRAPVRFALLAAALLQDKSDRAILPIESGALTEFRGGRQVYGLDAAVSAAKYFALTRGVVRLSAGVGPFVEVWHKFPETTIYDAGSPDERAFTRDPVTDWQSGVALAAPLAIRLGRGVDLVVDPSLRIFIGTESYVGAAQHLSLGLSF